MSDAKDSVQLTLTPEQREEIRRVTGQLADTLELRIADLDEERIAPFIKGHF